MVIKENNYSKRCLLFMHVPKAGGTTLHSIIDRQYDKKDVFSIRPEQTHAEAFKSIEELSEDRREHLKVIKGHMPFGLHQYLVQPFTYITYLRNPLKRVISNYYYLINNPGHYLYEDVTKNKMSLIDYVQSSLTNEVDNYQTRMFSGMNTDRFLYGKSPIIECTRKNLEEAKSNFDKYFCLVGLTKKFDESLLLLKRYLGWSNVYYFRRKETRYDTGLKIEKKTIQVIKERNQLDFELYDFAKKNFTALIDSQDGIFHDELRRFKRRNQFYGKIMKIPFFLYSNFNKHSQ